MSVSQSDAAIIDREHLRLLALGFWLASAVSAYTFFYHLEGILYHGMHASITMTDWAIANNETLPLIAKIFEILMLVYLGIVSIVQIFLAIFIKNRKYYTVCILGSLVSTMGFNLGTLIGVLSFITLCRTSVCKLFSQPAEKIS